MCQTVKNQLQTLISQKRYEHSLRVADLSKALAIKHEQNSDDAYLAALIHDAAKELSPQSSPIHFNDAEIALYNAYPKVWHALVIEHVGRHYFPSIDPKVFEAAKWHSTGTAAMSPLAKIVYVADAVEPGRQYDERAHLEQLAHTQLDASVFKVAEFSLSDLLNKKQKIHPETVNCYNFYLGAADAV